MQNLDFAQNPMQNLDSAQNPTHAMRACADDSECLPQVLGVLRGGLPHWPPLLLQVGPRTYTMHQDLFKIFFDSRFMYFFHRMYPASTCWWRRRRRSCPRSEVEEQDHPEAQETARELPGALRHGRQQVWGVDMQ